MFDFDFLRNIDTVEENLVTVFEVYLNDKTKIKSNFTIMRELDCWQGRADVVKVINNSKLKYCKSQGLALTNLTNARILSLLHYRSPRTLKFIEKKTYFKITTIKKSLRELIKCDLVIKTDNESYLLNPSFIFPSITFDAYEAKISNWRRALYQAIQYKGFANTSSVVMPTKHIANALLHSKDFLSNGIGLYEINHSGKVIKHIIAKKSQPRRKDFYLVGVGKYIEFISNNNSNED